jgi:hypothetical protein
VPLIDVALTDSPDLNLYVLPVPKWSGGNPKLSRFRRPRACNTVRKASFVLPKAGGQVLPAGSLYRHMNRCPPFAEMLIDHRLISLLSGKHLRLRQPQVHEKNLRASWPHSK